MERLRRQSTIFVPLFRWHNGRLTVRATYSQGFRWRYLMTLTQHNYRRSRGGVGNKSLFFFFSFFFQKVASNPTEYREDHFKLYPQVISPVSLNKKKKLLLESNSKGTIFSYRLGGMGGGGGGVFEITWFS